MNVAFRIYIAYESNDPSPKRKYCLAHMFMGSPKSVEISIWQEMMSSLVEFHM